MDSFAYFKDAVMQKYTKFDGRATRAEYWYFVLYFILISIGIGFVEGILGLRSSNGSSGILSILFTLGVLVPYIAVGIRRMHDIGKSGWLLLLGLIPLVGGIVLLVFLVRKSDAGDNAYGKASNPTVVPSSEPSMS